MFNFLPMIERKELQSHKKFKNISSNVVSVRTILSKCLQLLLIVFFQFLLLSFIFRTPLDSLYRRESAEQRISPLPEQGRCNSGRVYVYDLPEIFNKEMLANCRDLDPWHSRCKAVSNDGLGPRADGSDTGSVSIGGVVPANLTSAWYWTDMFAGEVVYHARMLNHECRTTSPEKATAFYIPFYAGLAVAKYLFTNYTAKDRDRHSEMLLRWVRDQSPWKRSNGSDHFIMLGRMTWDFRRSNDDDWGSSLLHMPLMKNILKLSVERNPWDSLEISVPYPTGFHPKTNSEMQEWLNFVKTRKRRNLFTFVGAKRQIKGDFRTILLDQCYNESGSCRVVECSGTRCYDGIPEILDSFLDSDFCLQPRGDAYTRKSMYDCMLAGSIPVFFWRRSIEHQYEWFLGDEPDSFSVFIDRGDVRNGTSIRKVLEGLDKRKVKKMREKVISFIPKFVYSLMIDSNMRRDAFDIAIDGVLRRFNEAKGGGIKS